MADFHLFMQVKKPCPQDGEAEVRLYSIVVFEENGNDIKREITNRIARLPFPKYKAEPMFFVAFSGSAVELRRIVETSETGDSVAVLSISGFSLIKHDEDQMGDWLERHFESRVEYE